MTMPRNSLLQQLKAHAQRLEHEVYALYWAYRDPRIPWYARSLAVLVVAYALSPIDLIPDFIPLLGYLDDLILVPLGIALALKLIPAEVMADARARATHMLADRSAAGASRRRRDRSRLAAAVDLACLAGRALTVALARSLVSTRPSPLDRRVSTRPPPLAPRLPPPRTA